MIIRSRIVFPISLALGAGAIPTLAQTGPWFTEITDEAGIDFVHDPGREGEYWAPEVMGSGGALFDFDGDGDLDVYLMQAGPLPESKNPRRLPNRLYRQDAPGRFTDATATSGLGDEGYGTGVAVGDIDNDGLPDVYVGNYGPDALYRNLGGGKFENVTSAAGIADDAWTASAVFCDYDGDGFLDLYVSRYVKHDPKKACASPDGSRDYCSPQSFAYERDTLYRNDGNGAFTDVSRAAGIHGVEAPGLGVLCADFTGDGRLDFYVANDGEANQLWENDGGGKFADQALLMGAALNAMGRPEASMGIAHGDVDADGDFDLFMTHLVNQTNTLYLNDGAFGFVDTTAARGLGAHSLEFTGFGTAFVDVEHDSDLDIVIVNGRVDRNPPLPGAAIDEHWNVYAEPNFLLENDGGGRFRDVSGRAGSFASQVEISRGLAVGDVDGDGDADLLVTNTAGRARLFRNDAPKKGAWLLVRALDGARNRDAHGAVVTLSAGGRRLSRIADPGYSYLSSNDPRAHFGVAGSDASRYDRIEVRWPDGGGIVETFPGGALNRVVVVEKGKGKRAASQ